MTDRSNEPHNEPVTPYELALSEAHNEAMTKLVDAGINVTGLVMICQWQEPDTEDPSTDAGTFVGYPADPETCLKMIWSAFQNGMAGIGYAVQQVDEWPGFDVSPN